MDEWSQLRVNSAALHACAPDWSWNCPVGFLKDLDLWVVMSGKCTVVCNQTAREVTGGDVFLLRPSSEVQGRHDPRRPLIVYAVHFDRLDKRGRVLPVNDDRLPPVHRRLASTDFIGRLLDRVVDCFHDPARRPLAPRWMSAVMLEIAEADRTPPGTAEPHDAAINAICDRVRRRPQDPHSVMKFADELGVTPPHFMRLFKARKNVTPSRFIVQERIEAAKSLLMSSNHSISRIADLLGYSDVYFFSRQFKQVTGMPPTKYRGAGR